MKITKNYFSKFWIIAAIVFPIVSTVTIAFAVTDSFGMISYYCTASNSFFWLHLHGLAFCPIYVTIGSIIVFGLTIMCTLLLGYIFPDLSISIFKCIRYKYSKLKYSYQKEILGNFSPIIYQDKNIFYLKIICPKEVLSYATVTYSLEYLKSELLKIEKTKPNTKNEFHHNLINNMLKSPDIIKTSLRYNFPFIKIGKDDIGLIPIFEIDSKEEIFYLFRESGKPKIFWNDEMFPKLDEISFGHGEYNFKIILSACNSFGKKIVQPFLFPIKY